jgi:hypothetical protein
MAHKPQTIGLSWQLLNLGAWCRNGGRRGRVTEAPRAPHGFISTAINSDVQAGRCWQLSRLYLTGILIDKI